MPAGSIWKDQLRNSSKISFFQIKELKKRSDETSSDPYWHEGDYFKDFGYGKDALEKLVRNMSSLPQINPPGRILSYCNSGFYVAGRPSKKQSSNWFLGLSVWRTFISSPKI